MDDQQLHENILAGRKQAISEELDKRAREALSVLTYGKYIIYVNDIAEHDGKVKIDYTTFPPVNDESVQTEINNYIYEVGTGNAVGRDDTKGAD